MWLRFISSPGASKPCHPLTEAMPEEGMPGHESPAPLPQSTSVPSGGPRSTRRSARPALLLQPQGGMASSHGRVLLFPKYVCCINTIVKCKPSVGDGGVGARAGRGSVPDHGQPRPAQPGGQCGGGEVLHPITLSGRTDPAFFKLHLAGTI